MAVPTARDDRRHEPGPELSWSESWTFDFADTAGSLGGWVRLTLVPNLGVAWYDAHLCGPGRQLLAVIDREVPLPTSPPSLEIRTTGLWADHICETVHDHWTLGLEAFALGVDDPVEIYGRQHGDRVPLGFDLEWEAQALPSMLGDGTVDYHQPCRVSGEILRGAEAIDFDGNGWRDHRWGLWPGWDAAWFRLRGRLDDGTLLVVSVIDGAATATVDEDVVAVVTSETTLGDHGLPTAASVTLRTVGGGTLVVAVDPVAVTPVEAVDPELRSARSPRALCWLRTGDARGGVAWAEWNQPQR